MLEGKCWSETLAKVQPRLFKSIITTKEAQVKRFTGFSFSGQTHFQWECYGHFSDSIIIAIFETLRRLDTTWNFACSITRVSKHEHEHWEHCLCTQSLLKRTFLNDSPQQLLLPLAAVTAAEKYRSLNATWHVRGELRWNAPVFQQQLSIRCLTWLFQLFFLVLFLIWGCFFNFEVNIVLADDKTTKYPRIYMKLSFRSVSP